MIAVLLGTLFTASALLAVATIGLSALRHGRAALALRGELAVGEDRRDYRVTITEITVRATATVLRPDFTPRPACRPALPAAA